MAGEDRRTGNMTTGFGTQQVSKPTTTTLKTDPTVQEILDLFKANPNITDYPKLLTDNGYDPSIANSPEFNSFVGSYKDGSLLGAINGEDNSIKNIISQRNAWLDTKGNAYNQALTQNTGTFGNVLSNLQSGLTNPANQSKLTIPGMGSGTWTPKDLMESTTQQQSLGQAQFTNSMLGPMDAWNQQQNRPLGSDTLDYFDIINKLAQQDQTFRNNFGTSTQSAEYTEPGANILDTVTGGIKLGDLFNKAVNPTAPGRVGIFGS